jgi:hypothetical protein
MLGGVFLSSYNSTPMWSSVSSSVRRAECRSRFWFHSNECLPVVEVTDDYFQNASGCYRVGLVRSAYFSNVIDESRVCSIYQKWRDDPEYFFLRGLDSSGDLVTHAFAKASKRGNDVYKARVRERFQDVKKLPDVDFLSIYDGKTPALFITLSVDPKRFTLKEAWQQISGYLHRFEDAVRREYGSFEHLRSFEAHESGYPHVHLLLFFHKRKFVVFPHRRKKDGRLVYRVPNKHNDAFHSMWSMGSNIDVLGVGNTKGFLSEVVKYITKDIFTDKAVLTNAMMWLFRKRQFSISKNFFSSIFGNYSDVLSDKPPVEPSGSDLVPSSVHNCKKEFPEIVKWEFAGMAPASYLAQIGINLAPDGHSLWYGHVDLDLEQQLLLGFITVGDL